MAGKMVHFELPAEDVARAKGFWSGVFGWDFGDSAMPDMEYYMVRTGEDQGGAVYPVQAGEKGPIVYFDTDDIDGSIAKVREHGGQADDKQPIPHVGWFARCSTRRGTRSRCIRATSPHRRARARRRGRCAALRDPRAAPEPVPSERSSHRSAGDPAARSRAPA
jgi:uncharacterized protein